MNSDHDLPRNGLCASEGESATIDLTNTVRLDKVGITTFTYSYDPDCQVESFTFEHDKEKHVFRLSDAHGNTACFRDRPARYLIVEPDPQTGGMRPATKYGKPQFLYLCREGREG
jgi:hypothetical protein